MKRVSGLLFLCEKGVWGGFLGGGGGGGLFFLCEKGVRLFFFV